MKITPSLGETRRHLKESEQILVHAGHYHVTAIDQGVDKVMVISLDKAENPLYFHGVTKLCA